MDKKKDCIFCDCKDIIEKLGSVFCIKDKYPVTDGHYLIIPFNHKTNYFLMNKYEIDDSIKLINILKNKLEATDSTISGFNIGINIGKSSGQTIMHAHIHLIPRRDGDIDNPRGGVRGVIPSKMNY